MASGTITPAIDLAGYKVKIYQMDMVFNGYNYSFAHGLGNITEVYGFFAPVAGAIAVNVYLASNPDYLTIVAQAPSNLGNGVFSNPSPGYTYKGMLILFYK